MKTTRRILSWVLAIALVITCGITGLVLPVGAEAPVDLLNGQGTFEDGTTPASTALSDLVGKSDAVIVDNPNGDGKVLQIGKFVDDDGDGENDGAYTHTSYPKWKKLYNAETDKYNKPMQAGKCYTLTMDIYGDGLGMYFQNDYHVLSHNADDSVSDENGWFQIGNGAEEWKTYTFVFYTDADIAETYHSDWWSWGMSWSKTKSSSCQPGNGYTYIDNVAIVETQATSVAIDSEDLVLEPGDVTEALNLTFGPAFSTAPTAVWSSDAEGVAKVDAATGVITAVANGTANITVTAGELTDTVKVTVQKDKTQSWADFSEATYATGTNKNSPVTVNVDAETGLEYVSVTDSAQVKIPNFCGNVPKDTVVGLTFLIRVTDAANNAGAVRAGVQIQSIVEGYTQPEFYARTAVQGGGWVRVTHYAKTNYESNHPWFQFITLAKPSNASANYSYDIADVSVFLPEEEDVNRFGVGGDFEDYVPVALGDNTQGGKLLTATEIVDDPTGADNKVLYIGDAAGGNSSGGGTYAYAASLSYHNAEGTRQNAKVFENSKMYKISFRVYSAAKVAIDSYGGGSYQGTTGTAAKSGQWRQVTTYMYTTGSFNSAYALHIRFYGEAYIDDLEMYECVNATGFEVKGDSEMTIGESQTLEIVSVPKHSFPGTLTTTVDGTGLTLSGTTVTAKSVAGTTVTGGTVTVTSTLTDAETGNPITGTFAIKVNYPEEHFVNGTMDTGSLDGLWFETSKVSSSDGAYAFGLDGVGIDGTKGAAIYSTGAKYFKSQTYVMKPNSTYVFSVDARANGTGAALELGFVSGNNNSGNKVVTATQTGYGDMRSKVDTQWTKFVAYLKTGETTTTMDGNWGLFFQVRTFPTGVAEGETATVFLDNISLQLISEGDNHYTGLPEAYGFEAEHEYFTPYTFSRGDDFLAEGEGINGTTALKVPNDSKTTVSAIKNTPNLDPYSIYKLSFWTKADQQYIDEGGKMALYWGSPNAGSMKLQASTNNGNFYATTEWKLNEFILVPNGKANLNTNLFYFNTSSTTQGTGYIYFDDMKLECIAHDNFLATSTDATAQTLSIDGGATWHSYLPYVAPGTTVQVKNWQYSGRIMVPGSLQITEEDGTVTKILNKDLANGYTNENFGVGDGRIFEFKMPETNGYVTVTFESGTDTNYRLGTVGTSLRLTDEEGVYDGIRFLTRLNLTADSFTASSFEENGLFVKHEGVEYEVIELGSWLKRYEEAESVEVELTAENALWTAVAYKKGETDLKALDYTSQYIDFTSVMRTQYTDRTYTARGYMVLDADGDGVGDLTITSADQLSNSIDSAAVLL